jgi:uncharacterized protein (TIGR03382 family)
MWCLMAATSAFAWESQTTESGAPLRWWTLPAEWVYADEGAAVIADDAVRAAFDTWTAVPGAAVSFAPAPLGQADANVVWWDTSGDVTGEHLAHTSTWSDSEGMLVSFDIAINAAKAWVSGSFDLQSTLTHEVGHALGLGHSNVPESVMSPTLMEGTWVRDLDDDDEEAVRALYPDLGSALPMLACSTGPMTPAPWALVGLLALRRRRR